jgi:hypothetical protein
VSSYFHYEQHLPQIEQYILSLPIFNSQKSRSFKDTFNIEFQDWNLCHYLVSDLSGLSTQLEHAKNLQLEYSGSVATPTALVPTKQSEISRSLSRADQEFLTKHVANYRVVNEALAELVNKKVLVTSVPIKLQTMLEKKLLIRNYDECVGVYNEWAVKNRMGTVYNDEMLSVSMQREIASWHSQPKLTE